MRLKPKTAARIWRLVTGLGSIYIGVGYMFGPEDWYQSPSLELVRQFVVPVPIWGTVMFVAGALILSKHRDVGHFIAMMLWTFWFACIAAVAFCSLVEYILADLLGYNVNLGMPTITGWAAPIYVLVYAMVHAHMLLGPRPVYVEGVTLDEGPEE